MVAALEMQSVAVGWQVYEITKKPFDLGLVGLAQFLPGIFFSWSRAHAADRFNRRTVLLFGVLSASRCAPACCLNITLRGDTLDCVPFTRSWH